MLCPILMLVVRGPTYLYGMFFVGLSFVSLLPLTLTLRTAVVLRMMGDPSHDVSLVRRGLRSQLAIDVVRTL